MTSMNTEMLARAIYEADPHYESGEFVDGLLISPGGYLSWNLARGREEIYQKYLRMAESVIRHLQSVSAKYVVFVDGGYVMMDFESARSLVSTGRAILEGTVVTPQNVVRRASRKEEKLLFENREGDFNEEEGNRPRGNVPSDVPCDRPEGPSGKHCFPLFSRDALADDSFAYDPT